MRCPPELKIDALLTSRSLGLELVESLAAFEPFGAGNPKPIFVTRGLTLRDEPFVMKDKHLKLKLARRRQPAVRSGLVGRRRAIKGANLSNLILASN